MIPSWGNGPNTVTRRYEEHEQAYFIPLAETTGRNATNPGSLSTYAVLIPKEIEARIMVMYAEQEAHPGVTFYHCKNSTTSSPSPS